MATLHKFRYKSGLKILQRYCTELLGQMIMSSEWKIAGIQDLEVCHRVFNNMILVNCVTK